MLGRYSEILLRHDSFPKQILLFVLFACLTLYGCGGSSGGSASGGGTVTVSGTVQKGLLSNLKINAYPLDPVSKTLRQPLPVDVLDQNYSIQLDANQTVVLEATGEFINDVNGSLVTLDQPLKVVLAVDQQNIDANINLLTTIVAEMTLQELPDSSLPVTTLINQQQTFVNAAFGLPSTTQLDQLDYSSIQANAEITDTNLQLLLLSAGIVAALENDQLFEGGFAEIVDGFLGANQISEAVAALQDIDGLAAAVVYDQIRQNSGYDYLPNLALADSPVLTCIAAGTCQWQSPGGPTVSIIGNTVYEAEGQARIRVRLSEVSATAVVVNVYTAAGTAIRGVDYLGLDPGVTIAAGETQADLDLTLIIDPLVEGTEDIEVTLVSHTDAYPVLQATAKIYILDGAPATLSNQNAANMEIRSVEAEFLCAPAGQCGNLNTSVALGIPDGSNALIGTKIDLAALCTDAANCPEQTHDWLVNFYLVAKDTSGQNQGEIDLGPYIYNRQSVQIVNQPTAFRYAMLSIGGDDVAALALSAQNNGWDVKIEARLGVPAITLAAGLPPIVNLPASVMAGETEVPLGVVFGVTDAVVAGCQQGDLSINAQYQFANGTSQAGSLCVQLDQTNPATSPAVVVEGSIQLQTAYIELPAGVSTRLINQYAGGPVLIPAILNTYPTYLHAEGWPFEFWLEGVTLSAAGIGISYKGMRYVMDAGYSAQDPRSQGHLFSNDIYYSGVAGQTGTLILNPDGFAGALNVTANANGANTAFPKAAVEWQAFTQTIDQSRLQPVQASISSISLQQATACSEPGCVGDLPQNWQLTASNVKLDSDGFVLGDAISSQPQPVVFGARTNAEFAWSRPDDLTLLQPNIKLAMPGYVIPASPRVSDYLLAHLDETPAAENLVRYPSGSDAYVDGNYHPIGLSIGPEIYRNAQGQPELGDGQDISSQGNRLTINNGVDAPFNLISSVAVKYVLRNAGLTGVFNVESNSLGAAQFYGYPLALSRFAVRATDNELDSYTWIDGRLALQGEAGGPDGLELYFTNLEINCAARLGNLDLLYERCDGLDNNGNGIDDENCAPRLYSWQTDTDIFAAGFSGADNTQACATAAQNFTLDQQLYFEALNKPVVFQTQWNPSGGLVAQTSGELPVYRFDQSEQGLGFPIRTSGAKLASGLIDGEAYGWLEMANTRLAVPFWNALDADLRVANRQQFAQLLAEPTVVVPAYQLAVQKIQVTTTETNKEFLQRNISAGIDLSANYDWGNTGFGFSLPVYYQPYQLDPGNTDADAQGRQSRFVGRTLSTDLFVMQANAGINFIEPKRTKLSFGASADFERLGHLGFQIDPTDPGSAAAVDDLLMSLKITSTPLLAPALTDFLETVDIVNRYASRGLDEVVEEGLQLAVKEVGQAVAPLTLNNQDPFITVSEALALVHSGPQQVIALLADELRVPLNNELFALENSLREKVTELENSTALPTDQLLAKIDEAISVVNLVAVQAEVVDAKIDDSLARATGLLTQAQNRLGELEKATYEIDQVLLQSVNYVSSVCNGDSFTLNTGGNGYLDKVVVRFAAVNKLTDSIRNSNAIFAAAETLVKDAEQKRRLNTAKRRIQEAVSELTDFVDAANKAVHETVCVTDINEVVAGAFTITSKIREDVTATSVALANAFSPVNDISLLHNKLSLTIIDPVRQLSAALTLVRQQLDKGTITAANIINKTDCIVLELTSYGVDTCAAPPAVYGISALIDQVFVTARAGIDGVIESAETALTASLDNLLPGANMTPQQIREMLVTEVMRSAPIKTMRQKMDQHFGEIGYAVNGIVLQYLDQLNLVIQNAVAGVTGPVNEALASATSVVRDMPLKAAAIDGYAIIAGNELERAHIGAAWVMRGADDNSETGFRAALDAESWSARHVADDLSTPTACAVADASSLLDVKISAYGLPINILSSDIELEKLYLGFTLEQNTGAGPSLLPIGLFGGINTMGQIGFTDAVVIDPAFAAGLGELQSYIGASAAANFSDLEAEVAFMVGRACPGNTVLTDLDPDVAKFLPSMSASGFAGAYLRGGATIPLIPGGCFLHLGVSADFGAWLFAGSPTTIGGLVGGGATGEVLCIASVRGNVRVAGTINTDGGLKLVGDAWGVAGAGFDCDKGTWTSVSRSRDDSWCGTGDIEANAIFENGKWNIPVPTPKGIF